MVVNHVKACVRAALRDGELDHLDMVSRTIKIGGLKHSYSDFEFWNIIWEMRSAGELACRHEESEGLLYYSLIVK